MALKVKCKCGTALKVPSAMADKKITCPGCEKAFVIPAARFNAAPKTVKTASAPTSAVKAPPAKAAPAKKVTPVTKVPAADVMPASLDDELSSLTLLEHSESSSDVLYGLSGENSASFSGGEAPLPAIQVERVAASVEYAQDRAIRSSSSTKIGETVEGPKRGYWSDAFVSFIYPFKSLSNVVTFGISAAIACLILLLDHAGCLGLVGQFIIMGWLAAMYLSVVRDTAAGSEDLPGIRMEEGPIDDIVKPMLRYIGAFACSLMPATFYGIAMATGAISGPMANPIILMMWAAAGIFLMPLFILMFAFNSLAMIFRIDLMMTTIFRTLLPYMAMWGMLLLVGAIMAVSIFAPLLMAAGVSPMFKLDSDKVVIFGIIFNVLGVYLNVVSMRIIGLYYLHFKRRFTIECE